MTATPIRILLLEDNPDDALLVQTALAGRAPEEFAIVWVDRLAAALALIQTQRFDAVLCDLDLPDSTGMATAQALAARAPALPLVVLTGSHDENLGPEAIHHGVQDYMLKDDAGRAMLARSLRYAIERKRMEIALREANETLEHRVAERTAEREQAIQSLRHSEARFRSLTQLASDWYWEQDENFRFTWLSDELLRRTGATRAERLGKTRWDWPIEPVDDEDWAGHRRQLEAHLPFRDFEFTRVGRDGKPHHLSVSGEPVFDEHGRFSGYRGVGHDITERRSAELTLKQLSQAIAQSPVSIVITDRDGRIEYVNPQFTRITGYEADEVIGRNPRILNSGEMPPEFYRELWETVTAGRIWRGELHNRHKNGTLFWEQASISPIVDAKGRITHFIGVKEDITERKQHEKELRRMHEELERRVEERTQALAVANRELESFSYSVSHDLRAPLRAIEGYSRLIEAHCAEKLGEPYGAYLARVRAGSKQMGQLIEDLLKLSHLSQLPMNADQVDLSALAQEVADDLAAGESGRRIEWVIAPGVRSAGDAGLLRLVLQNLLGNAWKYSSRRELARIEFGTIAQRGHQVYFVRDNGAGFDMAHAGRLFAAFQRLHPTAEFPGSGIGLATVARIVHRHGGKIWAESKVAEGATFYFTLARLSESEDADAAPGGRMLPGSNFAQSGQ